VFLQHNLLALAGDNYLGRSYQLVPLEGALSCRKARRAGAARSCPAGERGVFAGEHRSCRAHAAADSARRCGCAQRRASGARLGRHAADRDRCAGCGLGVCPSSRGLSDLLRSPNSSKGRAIMIPTVWHSGLVQSSPCLKNERFRHAGRSQRPPAQPLPETLFRNGRPGNRAKNWPVECPRTRGRRSDDPQRSPGSGLAVRRRPPAPGSAMHASRRTSRT
jgi:hypothetical protein